MTDRGVTRRDHGTIVDPSENDLTANLPAEFDWIRQRMLDNHINAEIAQKSTFIRMGELEKQSEALAEQLDGSFVRTHRRAKALVQDMDPNDKLDAAMIKYAVDRTQETAEMHLNMIHAHRAAGLGQVGVDIRKSIPPEPKPEPVIVQHTGPKLREARLLEGGKTKYVIED
jgi:hypothetical protein